MSKGQGKGRGEIDEQSWEESWRIKKENWMNEQGGWMKKDDLGNGSDEREMETRTVGNGSGFEIEE